MPKRKKICFLVVVELLEPCLYFFLVLVISFILFDPDKSKTKISQVSLNLLFCLHTSKACFVPF
jgi:hypothetical protein